MNKRTEMLGEAYRCGEFVAQIVREAREDGTPLRRLHYADTAYDRAQELSDMIGVEALDAFADGFDAILALPERAP